MGGRIGLDGFGDPAPVAQSPKTWKDARRLSRQPGCPVITPHLITDVVHRGIQDVGQDPAKKRAASRSAGHDDSLIDRHPRFLEKQLVPVEAQGDSFDSRSVQIRPAVTGVEAEEHTPGIGVPEGSPLPEKVGEGEQSATADRHPGRLLFKFVPLSYFPGGKEKLPKPGEHRTAGRQTGVDQVSFRVPRGLGDVHACGPKGIF